jgi:hypothetical protein
MSSLAILTAAAGSGGGGVIYAPNAFLAYDNRVTSTYDVALRPITSGNSALGANYTALGNGSTSANSVTSLITKDTGVGTFNSRFASDTETVFYFYYANESYVFSRQSLLSGMTTSSRASFCLSNDGLTGYFYWQSTSGGVRQIRKYTRDDIFSAWTTVATKTVSSAVGDDAGGRNGFDFFSFVEGAPNNNLLILGSQLSTTSEIHLYDFDANTIEDTVALQGKGNYPTAFCAKSGITFGSSFVTFYWAEYVSGSSSRVYKITCDLSALTLTVAYQYQQNNSNSGKHPPIVFTPHDGTLISVTDGGTPFAISQVNLTTGVKGTTYSYVIGVNNTSVVGLGLNEAQNKFYAGNATDSVRIYNFTAGTTASTLTFPSLGFTPYYGPMPFYAYDQTEFYP